MNNPTYINKILPAQPYKFDNRATVLVMGGGSPSVNILNGPHTAIQSGVRCSTSGLFPYDATGRAV